MQFIEGEAYHIYNRGNNQQTIFFNRENYLFFLQKIRKQLSTHVEIIAYCLMPNHFHLLIYVKPCDKATDPMTLSHRISKAIAILLRSYTRAVQKQEQFTGSLFQQKTKARRLFDKTSNYAVNNLFICLSYIHNNPVKAKLIKSKENWEFSSYREYANTSSGGFCNTKMGYEFADLNEDDFVNYSSDDFESSDE